MSFRALYSQGERIEEAHNEDVLKAEDTLIKFLQDSRAVTTIQSKFNAVIESITRVQNIWRDYVQKKEGFSILLAKHWDKNFEKVFQDILKGEYLPMALARIPDFKG